MASTRERRTTPLLPSGPADGSSKPKDLYLGGDSDMEEDVLDHVKELRRVNIVNTDNNDEDEKADNDDESTTERERELPPAVKLPSLKWTNKRVGGHLRRTRLWTSLHERLQADADVPYGADSSSANAGTRHQQQFYSPPHRNW